MIKANPYSTYADATREYLIRLHSLMEPPQQTDAHTDPSAVEMSVESLIQRAGEIADISASLLQLAHSHLKSALSPVRESIRCQFMDQATVELLLGLELMKIVEERRTGLVSTAAARATGNAALREAISSAEKSSSIPLEQGIITETSYRAAASQTVDEAAAALMRTVSCAASSICHRVLELGRDIAFDLIAGEQETESVEGSSLSIAEASEWMRSVHEVAEDSFVDSAAAAMLSNVYVKITAMLDDSGQAIGSENIKNWLDQMRQANKVEIFNALVENFFQIEKTLKAAEKISIDLPADALDSVNKASDLAKTCSDRFLVLTGRMRKLEDALRLWKLIRIPKLLPAITAMQTTLLAALVYSGYGYIHGDLTRILREKR